MNFNTTFSYFIIIIFSPLIGKLIKAIIAYYKEYKLSKTPNTLLQLVYRLTPHEFEIWSSEYLSKLGFTNVVILPLGPDGGKDIICSKNNEKYYVECKRYSLNNNVSLYHVKKLLGSMINDNIKNGIIITTGNISEDAKEFIDSLRTPYDISIITASDLDLPYSKYILESENI